MKTSVAVAIVSWPDFENQASLIESEFGGGADQLVVLHNGPGGSRTGNWVQFPDNSFFAAKFEWALDSLSADVLVFIVADTWCEDWSDLVERSRQAFASDREIGVWAPVVDETWWNSEKIVINTPLRESGLQSVIAVDSIVWAFSASIAKELKKIDFSESRYGWGIETVTASIALCNGKLVCRDPNLAVRHRRGTTYPMEVANREAQALWLKLPPAIRAMSAVIEEFALLKTVDTPNPLSRRITRRIGWLRDYMYRVMVKRFTHS